MAHGSREEGTGRTGRGHEQDCQQHSAGRPQVQGLGVDVEYLRLLVGKKEGSGLSALEAACSEGCVSLLRQWFDAVGDRFRETHLLSLLRRCTNMGDARILDVFDLLDIDGTGTMNFAALHLMICILAGRAEGHMKQFLYRRGKDSFSFLAAGGASVGEPSLTGGKGRPRSVKAARLFKFLASFGFDQYVVSNLHDLQLASRPQLAENEVSLFLFAVCQQHDEEFSALQMVRN